MFQSVLIGWQVWAGDCYFLKPEIQLGILKSQNNTNASLIPDFLSPALLCSFLPKSLEWKHKDTLKCECSSFHGPQSGAEHNAKI